jgi:hypothetical protein
MPVPWLKIVQWVPSILDLSRDLARRTKQTPPEPGLSTVNLETRIAALEENERRQAELVESMAQQSASLSDAVTLLHRGQRRMQWLATIALVLAAAALALALRH